MASIGDVRHLAEGLDHPEGIALGPDGLLYAGGEAGQIYRIDPQDGSVEQIASTGGFVLGLCLDAGGAVYACDAALGAVVRVDPANGSVTTYCDRAGGAALTCPNWPAFAPDGSLVVSDSGRESLDVCEGRVFRVPPGGGEADVLDLPPLHFANGLAVSPDGEIAVLESMTPRLSRVVDGGVETIADLPDTTPDGVAMTDDGGYLVSCYYPFRILRVDHDGTVSTFVDDPTGIHIPMPTNIVFYGESASDLAIASLGGSWVSAMATPYRGLPLNYPRA
jgi:gluconolactonase